MPQNGVIPSPQVKGEFSRTAPKKSIHNSTPNAMEQQLPKVSRAHFKASSARTYLNVPFLLVETLWEPRDLSNQEAVIILEFLIKVQIPMFSENSALGIRGRLRR